MSEQHRLSDWKWAIVGGAMSAALAYGAIFGVGQLTGARARALLEAVIPSLHFMASGVLAAGATILALMLTALSLSRSSDMTLHMSHYRRLEQLGWLTTITLVGAILVLGLLSVPMIESDSLDSDLYRYLYMGFMAVSSALTGLFVTVVLMLNISIRRLIGFTAPDPEAEEEA